LPVSLEARDTYKKDEGGLGRIKRSNVLAGLMLAFSLIMLFALGQCASTATIFSDDFQDGNSSGWGTSNGSWSVVSDGSYVYKQSGTSTTAHAYNGTTSWANYSVQARAKALSFNGTGRYIGIAARYSSSSNYYFMVLTNSNTVEIRKKVGGSVTTLASKAYTVTTGTWYTLKLVVSGTSLQAFVNGVQELSASDAAIAAGKIAVTSYNASVEFDDVIVDDLGGVATPTPTPSAATPTPTPSSATPTPTPSTATPTPTPSVATPTPTPSGPTPTPIPAGAMIGFAAYGGTTGGAGGQTVTVTTASDFERYVGSHDPYIVQVQGTIDLGGSQATVRENKTIIGLGAGATIIGGLKISHYDNLIVRNLTIKNSNNDGLTIQDCRRVWVDHCTFIDSADGQLDVVHGSDWVTVSWCKFYYTRNNDHNFVNLIGHDDDNGSEDNGALHVTFHHNWWSTLSIERMPSVRYGRVHFFNNYNNASGNNYCIRTRINAEVLAENNYFENVKNPWEQYVTEAGGTPGKVRAVNNVEVNTTWYVEPTPDRDGNQSFLIPGTDSVFAPPYSYTLESGSTVKASVMAGAGPQ
jgi:pectate lyase